MVKKKINTCWLLLLTLLYTASIVLAVAPAQARFNNTVVTETLLGGQKSGITSNCLITNRDPAVTVLAGELNLYASTTVSYWLHSSGAKATGTLRWGVSNPEHADYVRISMQSGADIIKAETDIELLEDVPMELTLIITPTETARNSVHEETKINVLVTWGDSLWGTFQVTLPEVKEAPKAESPEEATQPEETQPDTVPEETLPETEPSVTEPVTEPQETVPATQPETESPETVPVTEPETEPRETVPATEPETEPTEAEPAPQQETEPQETEPVQTVAEEETTGPASVEEVNTSKNPFLAAIATLFGIGDGEETTETAAASETTEPADVKIEPPVKSVTEPTAEVPAGETTEAATEAATEPVVVPETQPSTEPAAAPETEPSTEPSTEPTVPEEEENKDPIRIETLGRFDSNGMLPVRMVLTENVTSLRLGLAATFEDKDKDAKETTLEVLPLPRYTRFSLDGGKSYYMLAEACVAEFNVDSQTELPVLLDFRYTGMENGTGIRLVMDAYEGEGLTANCAAKTICTAPAASIQSVIYDRVAYEGSQAALAQEESAEDEETAESEDATESTEEEPVKLTGLKDSWVLNQNTVLVLALPEEWQDAELVYTVELLAMDEDGQLAYKRIDPEASGLEITHNEKKEDHNLVLKIGDYLPQAGTYRINMEWTYEGICYIQKQTTFFINYAADAGYLLSGLEVSNND